MCATGRCRSFAVRRRFRYWWSARAGVASVRCQQQLTGRARRSNPPLSYPLIDRSSRERKVAKSGEKYLRPIFANPDSRSILCATVWEFHPFRSFFNRAVRLAPHDRHSGTDFFGNESSEIEKSTDFGGGRVRLSRTTEMLFGVWRTKRFGQRHISRSFRETADFPNSSRPIFAMALNTKATHTWRGYFTDKIRVDTRVPVWVPVWNTWV